MFRTKSSPILKTQIRVSDQRRQLMMSIRVYKNTTVIERFNYYVNDLGQAVYLLPSELQKGNVINHPKRIRYTSLISFLKGTIDEIVLSELKTKTTLNKDLVRDMISNRVNTDFDIDFADDVNRQIVTFEASGYNRGLNRISVDKRAIDAVANSTIPTEPTVDDMGQVDLNDIDAGDIELMIIDEDLRLRKEIQDLKISKISTEIRYNRGLYNKENIFELFGSIYYNPDLSDTYNKIVIRLFEYRYYQKPKEEVKYFDENWVLDFFKFLWNEGYTSLSTRMFDPLKFNPEIFLDKKRLKYGTENFYKLFEIIKTVSNYFAKEGLLVKIDFSKINLSKKLSIKKKRKKGKRLKHNINYNEFNQLFFFKFNKKDLKHYQSIFSTKYDKSTIQISVNDLETARDLFCLQVMSGGLRGYRELQTLKFNKRDKHVTFYMKKIDYWMINPFNVYTSIIAKDYDYQLPKLNFDNSSNTLEHIYRALLKTIAEIIPFEREIIKDGEIIKIKDVFKPYFARKSFSQIMRVKFGMIRENISLFTGHAFESGSTLDTNYLDDEDPELKREQFDKIYLPEGFTEKTKRSMI